MKHSSSHHRIWCRYAKLPHLTPVKHRFEMWPGLAFGLLLVGVSVYFMLFGTGCGATPKLPPPTSLACNLVKEPPPWYDVEAATLPACVVVIGVIMPQGACCPPQTVCLTERGGQALIINKPAHTSWENEAWLRCRTKRE